MSKICVVLALLDRKKNISWDKLFNIVLNCIISKVKIKAFITKSY